MKLLISFLIWLVWLSLAIFSAICIYPWLLLTPWSGATSWWGNVLYPRGKGHNSTGSKWYSQWVFMAVRNPISNFGKFTLGVPKDAAWPWYVDNKWIRYGWGATVDERTGTRKFYFNPFKVLNRKFRK